VTRPSASKQHVPPPGDRHWIAQGMRAGVRSQQGYVLWATFVGFGGLAHDASFPLGAALLSVILVWAIPAQVLLIGGYGAGTPAAAIALAVGLSSARLLPLVVSILPFLRSKRGSATQFVAAHFIAIGAWVEGMRLLPSLQAEARLPFFLGFAGTFVTGGLIATTAGFALAGFLPRPLALGLVFLTPISFLLALARNARDRVDVLSLIFGLALAPLFAVYGGTFDLLWTGLVGGTAAWLLHRFGKRRERK
jgi:predicted branched-subunit amino acid permease